MKKLVQFLLFIGLAMGLSAQVQQPQQFSIPQLTPFQPFQQNGQQTFNLFRATITVAEEKLAFDPSRRATTGMLQDYVLNFTNSLGKLVLALGRPVPPLPKLPFITFVLTARTAVGDKQYMEVSVANPTNNRELQRLDRFQIGTEVDIPAKATQAATAVLPQYLENSITFTTISH